MRNTFKLCPLIDIICTNRRAEGARGEITDNTDTVNVCVIDRQQRLHTTDVADNRKQRERVGETQLMEMLAELRLKVK